MKRTWPIIGVQNVEASSRWYQSLLGQEILVRDHDGFTQICDKDATVLVGLHEWGAHNEGVPLKSPSSDESRNGLLLFIAVDDFEDCLERAQTLVAAFHEEPERPADWFSSFSVRDPDGYYVSINDGIRIKEIGAAEYGNNN